MKVVLFRVLCNWILGNTWTIGKSSYLERKVISNNPE
jgi:hypothetical protein